MAEPLPRAIPAPGDSLTRLVSCSLNNFLALFVLPFTLIDWNAYPPFEQPSRNERGIQHYHSPIPSIQVTGGHCTNSYGFLKLKTSPRYYQYSFIQGKPLKNGNICWPNIPSQLMNVQRVVYEEELSAKGDSASW